MGITGVKETEIFRFKKHYVLKYESVFRPVSLHYVRMSPALSDRKKERMKETNQYRDSNITEDSVRYVE